MDICMLDIFRKLSLCVKQRRPLLRSPISRRIREKDRPDTTNLSMRQLSHWCTMPIYIQGWFYNAISHHITSTSHHIHRVSSVKQEGTTCIRPFSSMPPVPVPHPAPTTKIYLSPYSTYVPAPLHDHTSHRYRSTSTRDRLQGCCTAKCERKPS